MANKLAIIIGIEEYQDKYIPDVLFAENDARAFAGVIEQHGFSCADIFLLVNEQATKTRIESAFRTIVGRLEKNDQLFVFYVGHGFSDADSNYLTCHDTVASDLIATSISFQALYLFLRKRESQRVIFFLDGSHRNLLIDGAISSSLSEMANGEFDDFCKESESYAIFSACRHDQVSFSSNKLMHGIWTYHLIEALTGVNRRALDNNRYLSNLSLQNHLNKEVPLTLQDNFSDRKSQTPHLWGNLSSEFILADLSEIFNFRAESIPSIQLKKASFLGSNFGLIKSLSGFKKHNRMPDRMSDAARDFVYNAGNEELTAESNQIFSDLKANFGYKRREITKSQDAGVALIITTDFTVSVSIDLDAEDFSRYRFSIDVSGIINPESISTDAFSNTFDNVFDRTVFFFSKSPAIEEIIDTIEEKADAAIRLQYPPDVSECSIFISGFDGYIYVDRSSISLINRRKTTIKNLLEIISKLPNFLPGNCISGLIS